jgi:hypothetical protein
MVRRNVTYQARVWARTSADAGVVLGDKLRQVGELGWPESIPGVQVDDSGISYMQIQPMSEPDESGLP